MTTTIAAKIDAWKAHLARSASLAPRAPPTSADAPRATAPGAKYTKETMFTTTVCVASIAVLSFGSREHNTVAASQDHQVTQQMIRVANPSFRKGGHSCSARLSKNPCSQHARNSGQNFHDPAANKINCTMSLTVADAAAPTRPSCRFTTPTYVQQRPIGQAIHEQYIPARSHASGVQELSGKTWDRWQSRTGRWCRGKTLTGFSHSLGVQCLR